MARWKLIAFDVDGTLIDTEQTGVRSLMQAIHELLGKDVSYEEAYGYFGMPSCSIAGLLNYPDAELFGEVWEQHFIELSHLTAPFPGIEEMLKEIRERGFMTCIVTSRNRMEFEYDKHLAKVLKYFDFSVCSEDTEKHKPDPEPMLKAIEKASARINVELKPEECIYIGDTMHDALCAKGAGCGFALADWKRRGKGNIPADAVFTDADGILEIMAH